MSEVVLNQRFGPDALDEEESRLLRFFSGQASAEETQRVRTIYQCVVFSEQSSPRGETTSPIDTLLPLQCLAPGLEPGAARLSLLEVAWLYAAWTRSPAPSLAMPWSPSSGGYRIDLDSRANAPRVFPVFAMALHSSAMNQTTPEALARAFDDLWALDLKLRKALKAGDLKMLLRAWLVSPGRQLVQQVDALGALLVSQDEGLVRTGAVALDLERIYEAAGWDNVPVDAAKAEIDVETLGKSWKERPANWLALHCAVPGIGMDSLLGRITGGPGQLEPRESAITGWVKQLTDGIPALTRWGSLALLLERALEGPIYELDGMQRVLREDLPVFIAVAHGKSGIGGEDPAWTLEAVTLELASRLNRSDRSAGAVLRTWGLARWLQGCLTRSPWFGTDLLGLSWRLRALLSRERLKSAGEEGNSRDASSTGERIDPLDPLDPARFAISDGIQVADFGLIAALLAHYFDQDVVERKRPGLFPMPLPLLEALRRMAWRDESPGERAAESAFLESGRTSRLHWRAPHVSPPWAARWLMTHFELTWLSSPPYGVSDVEAKQRQYLARLFDAPGAYGWLASTFRLEHQRLPLPVRESLLEPWRLLARRVAPSSVEPMGHSPDEVAASYQTVPVSTAMALTAVGLLDLLSDEESTMAMAGVRQAPLEWQQTLYLFFMEAAERHKRWPVWRHTVDGLLQVIQDPARKSEDRLSAAQRLLTTLPSSKSSERVELLQSLARLLAAPPFAGQSFLARELRRLGLVRAS